MSQDNQLASELQNVIDQLRRTMFESHGKTKLKGAQKRMLFLISGLNNGKPVTTSEVAKKLGVTLAAITHQINALEKEGLVERSAGKDDRRVIFISLSTEGKRQVAELKKEFAKRIELLADFLGEKDTRSLIHLVKKITDFPAYLRNNKQNA